MTKKDYFIPRMFYRLLIPSVISSFGYALADMADALVVGQKLGETGLAAISLCLPVFMLINLFMDSFGIGGSVLFSQKLGEGNDKEARDCFNRTWVTVLGFGLLIAAVFNLFPDMCLSFLGTTKADGDVYFACRDYMRIVSCGAPLLMLDIVFAAFLRNDNNAALASVGFLVGNITDILLNIVLVVFFDLGTKGAALATVIGCAVAVCLYMPGLIGKKADVLRFGRVHADVGETFSCFKIGFSTSACHLLQFVFFLVINRLLMAHAGQAGVAVLDVVYNVSFFLIYLYNGVAEASQPLISTFSGENSEADCRAVLSLSKKCALISGAAVAVLLALFAEPIASFFGLSQGLLPDGERAVRIYCIGFAFAGLNILNEKYYQSEDDFLPSFLIVLMRECVVLLFCALLFSKIDFSLIWYMYPVTELVTYGVFCAVKRWVVKKKSDADDERVLRMTVCNADGDIARALEKSRAFCLSQKADPKQEYAVTLAIEEVCMSIMRNVMRDKTDGKIRITVSASPDGDFTLHILDNAVEFNPFSFGTKKMHSENDFDIDEVAMAMIKKKAKKFMYRKCSGFNSLVIRI